MATNNSIAVPYLMVALLILGIPALWGVCKSPEEQRSEIEESDDEIRESHLTSGTKLTE